MVTKLVYSVHTFRTAGLEAKCGRTRRGQPCYLVRDPQAKAAHQRQTWWMVDTGMWKAMQARGVREGFDNCTLLGDVFSLNA